MLFRAQYDICLPLTGLLWSVLQLTSIVDGGVCPAFLLRLLVCSVCFLRLLSHRHATGQSIPRHIATTAGRGGALQRRGRNFCRDGHARAAVVRGDGCEERRREGWQGLYLPRYETTPYHIVYDICARGVFYLCVLLIASCAQCALCYVHNAHTLRTSVYIFLRFFQKERFTFLSFMVFFLFFEEYQVQHALLVRCVLWRNGRACCEENASQQQQKKNLYCCFL